MVYNNLSEFKGKDKKKIMVCAVVVAVKLCFSEVTGVRPQVSHLYTFLDSCLDCLKMLVN